MKHGDESIGKRLSTEASSVFSKQDLPIKAKRFYSHLSIGQPNVSPIKRKGNAVDQYLNIGQIQAALLRMLVQFDEICSSQNLRYSLVGGTLLGAIRHKGFIPWDDDVDIYMPRPDYERFQLLSKALIPDHYEITSRRNGNGLYPFIKFVDMRIRVQEPFIKRDFKEYLWIDIFPIDGIPDDRRQQMKCLRHQKRICRLLSYQNTDDGSMMGPKGAIKKTYTRFMSQLIDPDRLYIKLDKHAQRCDFESSNYAAQLVWRGSLARTFVPTRDFNGLITLDFEGYQLKAIPSWKEYLVNQYGADFMTLPPIDKRITHGFPAWCE